MLSHFSIEISQFVEIFEPEVLKKSRLCREISKILDKSRQSRFVSTISINISTKINLDRKISILKISTEKKEVDLHMMDILDGFQKLVSTRRDLDLDLNWSRLSRPPRLNVLLIKRLTIKLKKIKYLS